MHTYVHIMGKRLLTHLGSRTFCRTTSTDPARGLSLSR
jgi:hypothetical protein